MDGPLGIILNRIANRDSRPLRAKWTQCMQKDIFAEHSSLVTIKASKTTQFSGRVGGHCKVGIRVDARPLRLAKRARHWKRPHWPDTGLLPGLRSFHVSVQDFSSCASRKGAMRANVFPCAFVCGARNRIPLAFFCCISSESLHFLGDSLPEPIYQLVAPSVVLP